MSKERDGKFIFNGNMLSRQPNPVKISQEWVLINFKYQDPEFYARLFDNSGEGPFVFPPGHMKFCVVKIPLTGTDKSYVSVNQYLLCVLFIVVLIFFFGEKVSGDHFKDDILPSLKSKYRIKFPKI